MLLTIVSWVETAYSLREDARSRSKSCCERSREAKNAAHRVSGGWLLKKYKSLFEAYGTVMKEYVAVPNDLLAKTKELQKYLELSYEYAKTLRPKPTTKKKR
jgi:tRNA 2-selenouridine synthase SelU